MPTARLPLEDNAEDILGKAQRGLGFSDAALAAQAGLTPAQLRDAQQGLADTPDRLAALAQLAPALSLHAPSLLASAQKSWYPDLPELPTLAQFNTRWSSHGGIQVNNYAVWDPASKKAAIFDTGADASPLLALVKQLALRVELILLTHTHGDHVNRLSVLQTNLARPRTCVCTREPLPNTDLIDAGVTFTLGPLAIETRATHGHSHGGLTYVVHGLPHPVAIVGDALFAGSMGGTRAPGAWPIALQNNRTQILSLPADTIVCPGHGPLTTIAQEKAHNPFYPEYK